MIGLPFFRIAEIGLTDHRRSRERDPPRGTSSSLPTLGYGYSATANHGNVLSQTITAAGQPTFLQRYQYDSLNRLCLATENQVDFPTLPCQAPNSAGWSAVFTYDQYGNRAETATYTLGADAATALPQYDTNTNRLTWQPDGKTPIPNLTYDAAGNQTGDPGPPSATMQYDAEGRMTQEISGGNVATYTYDGDGRRVSKSVTGSTTATTTYLYDAAGQLAAEYSSLAPADSGITYLTGDHLGSTRLVTSGAGALHRYDYGPFGEDLAGLGLRSGLATDGSPGGEPLKFTGKERDGETGLDYFGAKYFSSAQGRWTSPDWSAKPQPVPYADLSDPQTLNLYSYVRNNPVSKADSDGHCSAPTLKGGQVGICIDTYIQAKTLPATVPVGVAFGDNRGPAPNDPTASYRQEIQLVVTPGQQPQMVKNDEGTSIATAGPLVLYGKGSAETNVSQATTDDNGTEHFNVSSTAINGLSWVPLAPKDTIKTSLNFSVAADGTVGLDPGGKRTAYPSIEVYSYGADGSVHKLLQVKESGNLDDLKRQNQPVPPTGNQNR